MKNTVKEELGSTEVFASNLARYLKASQKSQKEVAKAVGVSTGTFCDWLRGRAHARMDKIQALAEYFGINKSDLIEEPKVAKEDQEVLDLFHKIPKEKREFVLSMIRAAIDTL